MASSTPPKAQLSRETLMHPVADDYEEVTRKLGKAQCELIAVPSRPEAS